jgi:hypothetical protein
VSGEGFVELVTFMPSRVNPKRRRTFSDAGTATVFPNGCGLADLAILGRFAKRNAIAEAKGSAPRLGDGGSTRHGSFREVICPGPS